MACRIRQRHPQRQELVRRLEELRILQMDHWLRVGQQGLGLHRDCWEAALHMDWHHTDRWLVALVREPQVAAAIQTDRFLQVLASPLEEVHKDWEMGCC